MQDIIIVGAGGHAKVVIDIVELVNESQILGIADDDTRLLGSKFCNYPVRWTIEELVSNGAACERQFIVAIGDNDTRKMVANWLLTAGSSPAVAIHPSAQVSRGVEMAGGTVIMALSVLNPDVVIGQHTIINTKASIDHDCKIDEFVHISPGVTLCGGVNIGASTLVGAGATVLPGVSIGARSIVGAGALVTKSILDDQLAIGVPAHVINKK